MKTCLRDLLSSLTQSLACSFLRCLALLFGLLKLIESFFKALAAWSRKHERLKSSCTPLSLHLRIAAVYENDQILSCLSAVKNAAIFHACASWNECSFSRMFSIPSYLPPQLHQLRVADQTYLAHSKVDCPQSRVSRVRLILVASFELYYLQKSIQSSLVFLRFGLYYLSRLVEMPWKLLAAFGWQSAHHQRNWFYQWDAF